MPRPTRTAPQSATAPVRGLVRALPQLGDAVAAERSTAAERVAGALRTRITEGDLLPGTQLSEERLSADLGVSRNTLREAFRLLGHDGLLVHHVHRGVFVPTPGPADLADLFRLRRVVECQAVRGAGRRPDLAAVRSAVEDAELAAGAGDWARVGTANVAFHRALVALVGSPRLDAVMRRVLAELRLAFHVVASPRALFEPYVPRNRELLDLLAAGRPGAAATALERYLRDAERQLLDAYPGAGPGAAPAAVPGT